MLVSRFSRAVAAAAVLTAALAGCSAPAASEAKDVEGADVTFYIVRHGQTLFNVKGITSGWSDSPLTEKGVSQAETAAKALDDVPFDAAISSDLGRASTTAEIILDDHPSDVSLETTKLLREEYYGGFEGDTDASWFGPILESYGLEFDENWTDYPKYFEMTTAAQRTDDVANADPTHTAETWAAYEERLTAAVDLLRDEAEEIAEGNVLVVSHGTTIGTLLSLMDPDGYHGEDIPNASVTTVRYHDGGFTVEKLAQK